MLNPVKKDADTASSEEDDQFQVQFHYSRKKETSNYH